MKINDLRIGDTVTVKGHDFPMKVVGLFGDKDVQLCPCVEDYEGDVWEEDVADLELVKPRKSTNDKSGMKVTEDGFVWKTISAKAAELLFNAGEEEVYVLYDDDSEGLVDTPERLKEATERGCQFGVEVGRLPNTISTPDPAEFVKQLIPPLKWVDSDAMKGFSSASLVGFKLAVEHRYEVFNLFLNGVHIGGFSTMEEAKEFAKANLQETILGLLKL